MARRGIRLLIVATMSMATTVVLATPAQAAVNQYVHQFNLAGATMNMGALTPADVVVYSATADNPHPLVITTNEVCAQQYVSMRDRLAPLGYRSLWIVTRSSAQNCGNLSYGNVLFVSTGSQPFAQTTNYAYVAQDGSPEVRRLGCARFDSGGFGQWVGCVTHLKNNTAIARQQADEAIWVTNATYGSYWRFVGGDFNLIPTDSKFDIWYLVHFEADGSEAQSLGNRTITDGRKIDYVWMNQQNGSAVPPAFRQFIYINVVLVSDHVYYKGHFFA